MIRVTLAYGLCDTKLVVGRLGLNLGIKEE